MTAVFAIGAVQDHAANRGVELTPTVPPRSRERLEPAQTRRSAAGVNLRLAWISGISDR